MQFKVLTKYSVKYIIIKIRVEIKFEQLRLTYLNK